MVTNVQVLELLTRARQRIADKEHWTQGTYARDQHGGDVWQNSDEAYCWCASGAVMREAYEISPLDFHPRAELSIAAQEDLDAAASRGFGVARVVDVNDGIAVPEDVPFEEHEDYAHRQVLEVFDMAIRRRSS